MEQLKVPLLRKRESIPQPVNEPLLIAFAVVDAFPLPSRNTVWFWQRVAFPIVSITFTVALQVELFPLLSVTVKVTEFGPVIRQVNCVVLNARFRIPQASAEPEFTWPGLTLTVPCNPRFTFTLWQIAEGTIVSRTVMVVEQVALSPPASVTVSTAVPVPTFAQVRIAGAIVRAGVRVQLSKLPALIDAGFGFTEPLAAR